MRLSLISHILYTVYSIDRLSDEFPTFMRDKIPDTIYTIPHLGIINAQMGTLVAWFKY